MPVPISIEEVARVAYSPPPGYSDLAKAYLMERLRWGTMTAAAAVAGVSTRLVKEWRASLEGFEEEEELVAKLHREVKVEQMNGVLEGIAFKTDDDPDIKPRDRINAIKIRLTALDPENYGNRAKIQHSGEIGLKATWLDILSMVEDAG